MNNIFENNGSLGVKVESIVEESDFERVVENMMNRILKLGFDESNCEKMAKELHEMHSSVSFNFNPEVLASEMSRVQANKDRATTILSTFTQYHLVCKHAVDTLVKGWAKFSQEKSAERREGEALLKLSHFTSLQTDAEYYFKYATGIVKNIDSQLDTLSKQIFCTSIAAKIHDPRNAFETSNYKGDSFDEICEKENSEGITNWDSYDKPSENF